MRNMDDEVLTVTSAERNAIEVINLSKSYKSGRSTVPVLHGVNVKVPQGAIYGLLGPSGCGKTTLLKCILGRLRVDKGNVFVLGKVPGSPGHGVPGSMVGYMPQELALYNEFTIEETLNYFGRLNKMHMKEIKVRTQFLLSFLDLPEKTRVISKLSGGQMRRTSFAVALLHEPRILVLDEPTVGVDPLLRERIWNHLTQIAQTSHTSIIITTHYIEEARQADVVGLMRSGHMLAESSPDQLIRRHGIQTLEAVFLKLCQQDEDREGEPKEILHDNLKVDRGYVSTGNEEEKAALLGVHSNNSVQGVNRSEDEVQINSGKCCGNCSKICLSLMWNIFALIIKNLTIMRRNVLFLLFEFLLPSIQITLFCLCIGREPFNLPMAVVNNETTISFGALFLTQINNITIAQQNYSDMNAALDSVRQGETWGVIGLGENFTVDLIKRFKPSPSHLDNKTLEGSTIKLYLDMTNQQIALTIQQEILSAFEKFAQLVLSSLPGMNPAEAQIPVQVEQPIYGELNPSFTNFMAPGIIISVTFFMATGLTALSFVMERNQGLLERSFTTGVGVVEVMMAHVCTQFIVMTVQVSLMLIVALLIFSVPSQGSVLLVILLTLFQGFTGMALGLLISSLCDDENSAIMCALGTVYPSLILSGIIWPLQAMPQWLQYISSTLPLTYPATALRSILGRGWGLTYTPVWAGFLVSLGWGWGLLVLSALVLKLRGRQ